MTGQEISARLRFRPFHPFRFTMDNGQAFEIRHPEMANVSDTGVLYLYDASDAEAEQIGHPGVICDIRNISTLQPLPDMKRR